MALRRPVRARQPNGSRDWAIVGWMEKAVWWRRVSAAGRKAQTAPLVLYAPDAAWASVRTGRTRAIQRPAPDPASRNRRNLPGNGRAKVDVGRAHHPKTDIVVPVVRVIVIAIVRAGILWIVVPRAPAQHARLENGTPRQLPGPPSVAVGIGQQWPAAQRPAFSGPVIGGEWGKSTPPENRQSSTG